MYFKRVRKVALLLTFGISIPLFFFKINLGLGFVLGGLASIVGFEILRITTQKARLDKLKKSLRASRVLRMAIYAIVLIISLIFKQIFSVYSLFFGLFMIKLALVVIQYFMKGFDSNEYFDV